MKELPMDFHLPVRISAVEKFGCGKSEKKRYIWIF